MKELMKKEITLLEELMKCKLKIKIKYKIENIPINSQYNKQLKLLILKLRSLIRERINIDEKLLKQVQRAILIRNNDQNSYNNNNDDQTNDINKDVVYRQDHDIVGENVKEGENK